MSDRERLDIPWEVPDTFLGLEGEAADLSTAGAVVLPVPYEATVSYGGGTREGPAAILAASRQVELFDRELGGEPAQRGIHTLPALELTREGPAAAMEELGEIYGRLLDEVGDRFLVALGGEHSISAPMILAHARRRRGRLSVLQLDAHADLRDGYQGSPWSHASFAFRCLDEADFVQVGVRSVCAEEEELIRSRSGITTVWADEMWEDDGWMERALEALGESVYLTVDLDYFDPSLVPSTGTPEPGGGDWYRTLRFLRKVFRERTVVGCDVVELAPSPGQHASDFLAAKLAYKLMGYRFEAQP